MTHGKSNSAACANLSDRLDGQPMRLVTLMSLVGVLLVVVSTSRYGVGLSPDSTYYISAARSLLDGEGFTQFDGEPYSHWPPLYPALLAGLGLFGIEPLVGARFCNAAAFGLIIFCSGFIFLRYIKSTPLALIGVAAVMLSNPLYGLSTMALTGPMFVLLTLLVFMCALRYLDDGTLGQLLALALLVALCCLLRYVGAAIALAGGIIVLWPHPKVATLQRFKRAILYSVVSVGPLVTWFIRNRLVVSPDTEYGPASRLTLLQSFTQMCDTMTSWLVPEVLPLRLRLPGVVLVVCGWLAIALLLSRGCPQRTPVSRKPVIVAGLMLACYIGMVLGISVIVQIAKLSNRIMLPSYVLIFFLLLSLGDYALGRLQSIDRPAKILRLVTLTLCGLWLVYPATRVGVRTWQRAAQGAGGYATSAWIESPTLRRLASYPLGKRLYSNSNDAVYILTGMPALRAPSKRGRLDSFVDSVSPHEENYLVWFARGRSYYYKPAELESVFEIETVEEFEDGGIYRFRR